MRPLSAIDAIGPAWSHTRRLLPTPRNWRLFLKIGAVAFFAQVGGCNGSYSAPSHGLQGHSAHFVAATVAIALTVAVFALAIGLVFFYLRSRLQFVLFEIVLRSETTIAPIWRRYGRATWYWMALKVLFFLAATICALPILIPIVLEFIHSAGPAFSNGQLQNPVTFVLAILAFLGAMFFLFLLIGIAYLLLHDFGLPSMALESTSLTETVRRVWHLLRAEPGPVLLYVLMRFLLGIACAIVADCILFFAAMIALIPLGGAALIDWFSLRHATFAGHVAMICIWVVLGLAFLVLLFLAGIMLLGYVFVFMQAYALYFLGGRYPLVGAYLAPFVPPPHPYSGMPPIQHPPPPSQPPPSPPPLPVEGEP
jgi:hypothetical protein